MYFVVSESKVTSEYFVKQSGVPGLYGRDLKTVVLHMGRATSRTAKRQANGLKTLR